MMTQACWCSPCAITTFFCVVATIAQPQTASAPVDIDSRVMEVMKMTVTLLSQHMLSQQEEVGVLAITK